jgi:hypothetical protein
MYSPQLLTLTFRFAAAAAAEKIPAIMAMAMMIGKSLFKSLLLPEYRFAFKQFLLPGLPYIDI